MENFKSVHQMQPLIMGTDIGHAHNEDNDEDKKNFNKLNTKFYTLLSLIDFFTSFGGMCA